jgi:hypothetical protein
MSITGSYWIHPQDYVRRRRWAGPAGSDPAVARHAVPRFA